MNQAQKPKVEYELYKRLSLLGEGSFGKAYLVESQSDKSKWVIKQISLDAMSPEEKKESFKEAKILEQLNHPNIVKFKEIYKTKSGKLCIVMEYADGGDLQDRIKKQRGRNFKEEQILDWFTQICLAMKHVHDRKILHRDLKGQNIFLTSTNICKLGDFGIARVLNKTFEKAKTMVGTPYYLSPEIINSVPYSFKSDVWSIGVVLYEMCALKPPFSGDNLNNLALNIVRGQYQPIPNFYSSDLKKLVNNLLQTNPASRYSIQQILALPFIRNRIKNFLSETIKANEFSHTILHNQKINLDDDFNKIKNVQGPPPPSVAQQMREQKAISDRQEQQQKVLPNIDQKQDVRAQQQQKYPQQVNNQNRPQTPVYNQVRPINVKNPSPSDQRPQQNKKPSSLEAIPHKPQPGKLPSSGQPTPIGKENSSENKKLMRQPSKDVVIKNYSIPTEQEENNSQVSQQQQIKSNPSSVPSQQLLKQNPSQQKILQKVPSKPSMLQQKRPSTAAVQGVQKQQMTPKSQPASKPFYPPKQQDRKQSAGQILVSNQVSRSDQGKPPMNNNRPITAIQRNITPQKKIVSNPSGGRNIRQEINQKRQEVLNKVKEEQEKRKQKLEELKKLKMEASIKQKKNAEQARQNMYKDIEQKRQIKNNPWSNAQQVQQQQVKKQEIQIEWMGTMNANQPPERPKYVDQLLEQQKQEAERYNQEMALRKQQQEEIDKKRQIQEQMYEENKREKEKKQREQFLMELQENSNPQNYPQKGFAKIINPPQNNNVVPSRQEIEISKMMEEMQSLINEPPNVEDYTTNDTENNVNQNINFEDAERDDDDDNFESDNIAQPSRQQSNDGCEYAYVIPNNKQQINKMKESFVNMFGPDDFSKLYKAIQLEIKKNKKFLEMTSSEKLKAIKSVIPSIKFDRQDFKINQLVDIIQIENY